MKRQVFLVTFWILCLVSVAEMNAGVTMAAEVQSFPSCASQTQPGDRAHYDLGWHQIVGEQGWRQGSDDVYSLEEGNFLQCFCPVDGIQGIQTDWWKAAGLNQEEINLYTSQGWLFEGSGNDWNLQDAGYLARNSNFQCGEGEITPTSAPATSETPTPMQSSQPEIGGSNFGGGPIDPPVCPDPQPQAPMLLSVTKSGEDSVDLVWTEVETAEYYVISYGLEMGKDLYGVPNAGKTTGFRIGGLDLNKKYYFRVRSHRGCAPSEASDELSYPASIGGQVLGLASTSGQNFGWLAAMISGLMLMSGSWLGWKKQSGYRKIFVNRD